MYAEQNSITFVAALVEGHSESGKPKILLPMAIQTQKQRQGQIAEKQAKKLLQNKGYSFITQNFHSRFGEIDLIFQDGQELVFVEVKQRENRGLIHPLEAITPQKLTKIQLTAQYFFQTHPQLPQFGRIDAVSVINYIDNKQSVEHIKNISLM